jgi:hypothetical protein
LPLEELLDTAPLLEELLLDVPQIGVALPEDTQVPEFSAIPLLHTGITVPAMLLHSRQKPDGHTKLEPLQQVGTPLVQTNVHPLEEEEEGAPELDEELDEEPPELET